MCEKYRKDNIIDYLILFFTCNMVEPLIKVLVRNTAVRSSFS